MSQLDACAPRRVRLHVVAEFSLRLVASPDAPAEARRALRRFGAGLTADLMQVVALLTSELVANSVRHAGTKLITVLSDVGPGRVRVEVCDEGPGFVPEPRPPGDRTTAGGWGLYLIDELSSRWGVADGDGARVWFEVDR
jgi:anti-sigma regulatory factor (Ser/Thr protein kinase)